MAKRVGVVLSGCGHLDGAEIHEAVITLLALDRAGAEVVCMAPNVNQSRTVNHLTGERSAETRNVMVEAARIARGQVRDVAAVKARELDAVVLPGGYGAALNLSTFAERGAEASVDPEVARLLEEAFSERKVIGAICIAPGVIARVLGKYGVTLTIGTDPATAAVLERCGAKHETCATEGVVVDEEHRIVSTPAYMLGPSIRNVAAGIELLVSEVMRMA